MSGRGSKVPGENVSRTCEQSTGCGLMGEYDACAALQGGSSRADTYRQVAARPCIARSPIARLGGDVPCAGRAHAVMPSDSRHLLTLCCAAAAMPTPDCCQQPFCHCLRALSASSHCLLLARRLHSLAFARVCNPPFCLPASQPAIFPTLHHPGSPYQRYATLEL